MSIVQKFPERLRYLRKHVGWSESELARRSGLSSPTIAKLEQGKVFPNLQTVEKIAQAFNLTVVELLDPEFDVQNKYMLFYSEFGYLEKLSFNDIKLVQQLVKRLIEGK